MIRKITDGMSDFFGWFPSKTFENNTCIFVPNMANTCVFDTKEGLVIFDVPIRQFAQKTFEKLRRITSKTVKYIIYSHGHFDHAFGYGSFIEEIRKKGWDMPEVIAHENCIRRFEKYEILDKYHDWINKQQFASVSGRGRDAVVSARETLDPTIILKGNESSYSFKLGELNFKIYHDIGETDDSIWLWVPEKKTICTGDLMVSSFPNIGNPFKVQRYPKDWAVAMEKMSDKNAEYLVPGHGRLIEGKDNVRDALSITAEVMHFVHDEVVKRLNEGKWFEQIYHEMLEIYPEKFKKHKILRCTYGCYRFAIHAVYRLYHGWYNSGNPTDLFPSRTVDIAREFLKLNSESKYLEHANNLFIKGKLQLALHILDVIIKGIDEQNVEVLTDALKLKMKILKIKAKDESAFIANNILNNGVQQIKEQLQKLQKAI
ncbi:MAG: MBL fold metallo-hydrolase [Candidatus Lokiarchaeota archaeon]|nr:MBL fold metallo-hydrolase [Candidatus Lokiarchaeota archaeon]